jgi:hypothetical protein
MFFAGALALETGDGKNHQWRCLEQQQQHQ